MTRMMFGGRTQDVYLYPDDDGDLHAGGGQVAKFYTQQVGGDQHTDLLNISSTPITYVTTSTGADGAAPGQLPQFYGPDGYFELWVSVNDSPRQLMDASNLGSYFGPLKVQFAEHATAANPHGTGLLELTDVDAESFDGAAQGSAVVLGPGGLFIAGGQVTGGGGGSGDVTLGTAQTFTATKTFSAGDPAQPRIVLRAATTGQSGDVLAAYSGTDTGQGGVAQRTTYLNNKGELRVIAAKSDSVPFRVKGQTGQSVNVAEITDTANVVRSWWRSDYGFHAPNSGRTISFAAAGNVATGAGEFTWTNDCDVAMAIRSVRTTVGTSPTGASLIVDIKVNGVTIFGTPGNRPTIAAGSATKTSGKVTGFSVASIPVGAVVTADVLQVGSSVAGANLTIQIEIW